MDITEQLISLVQTHRCLYDCREKDFKNVVKKEMLWEKISKQLDHNCDSIKKKWKNLKDGYAKHKKNAVSTTGKKNAYVNWVWGPYLTFLDGAMQPKTTISAESVKVDTEINSTEVDTSSCTTEDFHVELSTSPCTANNISIDESQAIPDPSTSRGSRKRQASDDNIAIDKVLQYLSKKETRDSADLLMASYAKSLKKMKPETQASVKIQLAQIFAEAELQDSQSDQDFII